MIELVNVCAGYDDKEILHGVHLKIQPGKVTVLVGPNGCGKSTLLKTLVRLNPHVSGQISVAGRPITTYSSVTLARQIAYLPQKRNVPDIGALRMVLHGRFPYLRYPRRYRSEDIEKAREALRWVGMEDLAEENVNRLSGGNQQSVYIAMALAQDTPVILMDEPTTYLDISHQLRVMELVRRLAEEGKAVLLVLHDLLLALQNADYIGVMDDGKVVHAGSTEDIYESKILDKVFGIKVCRMKIDDRWKYYYE